MSVDDIRCPYCGAEMEEDYSTGEYSGGYSYATWRCPVCNSNAPIIEITEEMDMSEGIDRALAAAMQRYQPENRVLTLEELGKADHERNLYFETRDFGPDDGNVFESSVECAQETFCDEDEGADARKEYGVRVRCWLRRPTDEEREAVAWDE